VKRTGRDSGAARATTEKEGSGRFEPSRRPRASKPDATVSVASRPPADAAAETELGPGLYLVATPIGNLGDVTLRALAVLRGVDRIFCEDTRITARLLARFGITTPLGLYHDHNAEQARPATGEGRCASRIGKTRHPTTS